MRKSLILSVVIILIVIISAGIANAKTYVHSYYTLTAKKPSQLQKNESMDTAPLKIIGDDRFKRRTLYALNLLRTKAPDKYHAVIIHVPIVESVYYGSGIIPAENPPRFRVGMRTSNANLNWYAGALAHEACHVKLYTEGKKYYGYEGEKACSEYQAEALQQIGADHGTIQHVKLAPHRTEWWNKMSIGW